MAGGPGREPSDVFVGMEATGHYWMALFARLAAEGHSVCVINPMEVKAVRKLKKGKSKVKNDRVDALLIAETLRIGEYVEPSWPPTRCSRSARSPATARRRGRRPPRSRFG